MPHDSYSVSDWLHYLTHNEIDFIKALSKMLPEAPRVAQLGAGGGTSGLAFMEARPDLFLYSIDQSWASNPLGCLEAEIGLLQDAGYISRTDVTTWRYLPIQGDTVTVGLDWTFGKIDMVLVDAGQEYQQVLSDLQVWMRHLKPGGVIAVHDYHKIDFFNRTQPEIDPALIKPHPGKDQAVAEILEGKYQLIQVVDTLVAYLNYPVGTHHEKTTRLRGHGQRRPHAKHKPKPVQS